MPKIARRRAQGAATVRNRLVADLRTKALYEPSEIGLAGLTGPGIEKPWFSTALRVYQVT